MDLSRRILSLSPSPTVSLNAKAKKLAGQGHTVLNFAVGEPDYPTPPPIVERCIEALKEGKTRYGAAGGGLELRQAIAKKLKTENKLDYDPACIVAGIGAKEILLHMFLALVNDGDEVLLPAPYWVSYPEQIKAAGGKPVVVPVPGDLTRPVSPESIDPHVTSRTRGIVLNSPNNPAGYILKKEQLKELGEYIRDKNLWVISDEIYEYMAFDSKHYSMLELVPELADRFLLVNGVSKAFAMTGWRVGYGAGPQDAMKLVKSLQGHSSTSIPGFIEPAATWAITQGPSLMAEQIAKMKARRDLAMACLKEIKGIDFIPPEGAFYIFIDLRNRLKASSLGCADTLAFGEKLLTEHHLAMVPGEAFGTPGFIRLSYATDEKSIELGMKVFKKALDEI